MCFLTWRWCGPPPQHGDLPPRPCPAPAPRLPPAAPTCGPCRTLKPILSKLLEEYPGKVHYVEIDVEQDPEVAEAAGVSGTPTVQLFKHKERLAVLPGVRMRADYRKAIAPHLD